MTEYFGSGKELGVTLNQRLGLNLSRRGKELKGKCISCNSSDAFHLSVDKGVGHCFSCGKGWSACQVATIVLHDEDQARALMIELGVRPPDEEVDLNNVDPIALIALQKGVTREAFVAFGAVKVSHRSIEFPAYGPDGKPCTTFRLYTDGSKGLFAKGKHAGLFLPIVDGKVRLPKPGETWLIVEGVKDAAALWAMGFLVCGLYTNRLNPKFARLFRGVKITVVPDRDAKGEEGAQATANALHRVARSIHIATLPAEFKEKKGEDVRDILKKPDGEELVRRAIEDAVLFEVDPIEDGYLSAEIELPEGESIQLIVHRSAGKPQRLVIVQRGDREHRDNFNPNSNISRERFFRKAADKFEIDEETIRDLLEQRIIDLADDIDQQMGSASGQSGQDSQATIAVGLADGWDLWHTSGGDAYATYPKDDHLETWSIKSLAFKRYVQQEFFKVHSQAIGAEALNAALGLMEAKALFHGEERPVFLRVGEHGGKIYIDLCNKAWEVVEVDEDGWRVLTESPIRFRRSKGALALPHPERDGDINLLRGFLNVDDASWILIVAWLLASLRPRGPYPILALCAEQGSGKSTAARMLRSLVDPNAAPLRSESREARDLMITAHNSWCLAFDNISRIPPDLSDAMCRMSTGGGFATRELYTNMDETIFDSMRPMLLTSIDDVATRSDLLDRSLVVILPTIPEDARKLESNIYTDFDRLHGKIFGALLTGISGALKNVSTVRLKHLPRMADMAAWVTAAESALGWEPGTFLNTYSKNRNAATEIAIEASAIGQPLLEYLRENAWDGTSTALLAVLNQAEPDASKRPKHWPKDGRALSSQLKRIAPNLRQMGFFVDNGRSSSSRKWTIRRNDANVSGPNFASSICVTDSECNPMQTDAKECELSGHDANDANDANLPTPDQSGIHHNQDDWEEGEL